MAVVVVVVNLLKGLAFDLWNVTGRLLKTGVVVVSLVAAAVLVLAVDVDDGGELDGCKGDTWVAFFSTNGGGGDDGSSIEDGTKGSS